MPNQVAAISEIFSSLQGEGTHLGERHLFVRFEACNIHCEYCDELGKPGYDFDLESVIEGLKRLDLELGPHSYVSLTGGEPLLYLSFLKPLLARLKECGFRTYLETNGILWKALAQVMVWTDVVAMDVKPASVTKERSYIEDHEKFLNVAIQKEVFIKMVCSKEIDLDEFRELCEMIRGVTDRHCEGIKCTPPSPLVRQKMDESVLWRMGKGRDGGINESLNPPPCSLTVRQAGSPTGGEEMNNMLPRNDSRVIPLILQPISEEVEGHEDPELMRLLGELQVIGLGILKDVRIVPRLHKILKIR